MRLSHLRQGLPVAAILGLVAGVAVGAVPAIGGAGSGFEVRDIEVLHTPPLLIERGERPTLNFELVCPDLTGPKCSSPRGTLRIQDMRRQAALREVTRQVSGDPLLGGDRLESRLSDISSDATSIRYSIEFAAPAGLQLGQHPVGGGNAPHVLWIADAFTRVHLGEHRFGSPIAPVDVAVTSNWGSGLNDLGLDTGSEQATIGPSAFAVASDGTVTILDQLNRRMVDVGSGGKRTIRPIEFRGADGDLALASSGDRYVLDNLTASIARYSPQGQFRSSVPLAQRSAAMLSVVGNRLDILELPAEQWMTIANEAGSLRSTTDQIASARSSRKSGSDEIVLRAFRDRVRVGLVDGDQVLDAWEVLSDTALGSVQLAERTTDGGVLLIVTVYTNDASEYVVMKLAQTGLQ